MGVTGLWQLISSTGKPVPLESLEGKVLAVDVSVWLHQLSKGMRDSSGNPVPNAHLHGLFTRICKLLHCRIKPVFVFDGGVPALKKQTLAKRKLHREDAEKSSELMQQKILTNLIRSQVLQTAAGDGLGPIGPYYTKPKLRGDKDAIFELPPIPESSKSYLNENLNQEDAFVERRELQALIEEEYEDVNQINVESEDFKSLPAEIQHEIIFDIQQNRKNYNMSKIAELPSDSNDFSSYQMSKLLKHSKLHSRLEEVRKEINNRHTQDLSKYWSKDLCGANIQSCRLVSDETSHVLLIKGLKNKQKNVKDEERKRQQEREKHRKNMKLLERVFPGMSEESSYTDELLQDSDPEDIQKLNFCNVSKKQFSEKIIPKPNNPEQVTQVDKPRFKARIEIESDSSDEEDCLVQKVTKCKTSVSNDTGKSNREITCRESMITDDSDAVIISDDIHCEDEDLQRAIALSLQQNSASTPLSQVSTSRSCPMSVDTHGQHHTTMYVYDEQTVIKQSQGMKYSKKRISDKMTMKTHSKNVPKTTPKQKKLSMAEGKDELLNCKHHIQKVPSLLPTRRILKIPKHTQQIKAFHSNSKAIIFKRQLSNLSNKDLDDPISSSVMVTGMNHFENKAKSIPSTVKGVDESGDKDNDGTVDEAIPSTEMVIHSDHGTANSQSAESSESSDDEFIEVKIDPKSIKEDSLFPSSMFESTALEKEQMTSQVRIVSSSDESESSVVSTVSDRAKDEKCSSMMESHLADYADIDSESNALSVGNKKETIDTNMTYQLNEDIADNNQLQENEKNPDEELTKGKLHRNHSTTVDMSNRMDNSSINKDAPEPVAELSIMSERSVGSLASGLGDDGGLVLSQGSEGSLSSGLGDDGGLVLPQGSEGSLASGLGDDGGLVLPQGSEGSLASGLGDDGGLVLSQGSEGSLASGLGDDGGLVLPQGSEGSLASGLGDDGGLVLSQGSEGSLASGLGDDGGLVLSQGSEGSLAVTPDNLGSPEPSRKDLVKEFQAMDEWNIRGLRDGLVKEEKKLLQERGKQERLAMSITDQMHTEAQELLQLFGIPYIVSPTEAEAQCAQLDYSKQTQGTITDDSDIWLFGGTCVYKNFFNQQKHVECFKIDSIQSKLGLTRHSLINIALLCGSDYTDGIQGVGPVTAMEILAEFPGDGQDGLINFRTWWEKAQTAINVKNEKKFRTKLRNLEIKEGFPHLNVVQAYLNPTVDDSTEKFTWGTPDLDQLTQFAIDKLGWTKVKVDETLQPVLKRMNDRQNQMRIGAYFQPEFYMQPAKVKSKRLQTVVDKFLGVDTGDSDKETSKSGKGKETKGKQTKKVDKGGDDQENVDAENPDKNQSQVKKGKIQTTFDIGDESQGKSKLGENKGKTVNMTKGGGLKSTNQKTEDTQRAGTSKYNYTSVRKCEAGPIVESSDYSSDSDSSSCSADSDSDVIETGLQVSEILGLNIGPNNSLLGKSAAISEPSKVNQKVFVSGINVDEILNLDSGGSDYKGCGEEDNVLQHWDSQLKKSNNEESSGTDTNDYGSTKLDQDSKDTDFINEGGFLREDSNDSNKKNTINDIDLSHEISQNVKGLPLKRTSVHSDNVSSFKRTRNTVKNLGIAEGVVYTSDNKSVSARPKKSVKNKETETKRQSRASKNNCSEIRSKEGKPGLWEKESKTYFKVCDGPSSESKPNDEKLEEKSELRTVTVKENDLPSYTDNPIKTLLTGVPWENRGTKRGRSTKGHGKVKSMKVEPTENLNKKSRNVKVTRKPIGVVNLSESSSDSN